MAMGDFYNDDDNVKITMIDKVLALPVAALSDSLNTKK